MLEDNFVALSTKRLPDAGVMQRKRQATKELAEEKGQVSREEHNSDASSRRWSGGVPVIALAPGDPPGLTERNVEDWWFLANDALALEEV